MAAWHRAICGWKFQNVTPTVFISCQPNFMRALGYHGEMQAITFLGTRLSFKNFVALVALVEILTLGINGKT